MALHSRRTRISCSAFYYAIANLTLADSTSIFFTAPLYTGFFGYLFLSESIVKFDLCCTFTSAIGVVMIVRPAFLFGANSGSAATAVGTVDGNGATDTNDTNMNTGSTHSIGILVAIAGSLLSALVYIAIRKIGPGVNPLVLVAYMGMCGIIVAPFGGIFQTLVWPSTASVWFGLLLIGTFSFVGQILFNAGVQREKAGPASMIRNLDVAFAFMWQIVIEGIAPNPWSVLGAFIISACVVAIGLKKMSTHDPSPPVTAPGPPAPSNPPSVPSRKSTDRE